jgi:Protein of unknown function (DUF3037)
MADLKQFEFFLLRYVPDAVKGEFVNIGLVMMEAADAGPGFADVRFTRDWRRVRCLDPQADVEMLEAVERDIRGQLQGTKDRELLLRKLEDSLSNLVQISPMKACLGMEPAQEMSSLAAMYLESPKPGSKREMSSRQRILRTMRDAFEQAGVWALLRKEIAAAQYTHKGDPLKIDCGYRPNGVVKMFQAVPLAASVDAAKVLAFSHPEMAEGIRRVEGAAASLTAVVEDGLDRSDEAIGFALAVMEKSGIALAEAHEMAGFAEVARRELRA